MPVVNIYDLLREEREKKLKTSTEVKIKNGRCNAHMYHLENQGDSSTSRYIYRCLRPYCNHYSTIQGIQGRPCQCPECEKIFIIDMNEHIIRDVSKPLGPEMFHEFPQCCRVKNPYGLTEAEAVAMRANDAKIIAEAREEETKAKARDRLDRMAEETDFDIADDRPAPPSGDEETPKETS